MSLMQNLSNDWTVIKADFKGFVAKVVIAAVWLQKEAPVIVAWATKIDPAVGAALALIIQAGELAAETLASHAAAGLDTQVNNASSTVETSIANAIQSSGLNIQEKAALTAADVAVINKLRTTYHATVDAGFAKVLGALAPPLAAAQPSPTPATAAS